MRAASILVGLYSLFAAIATGVNIGSQWLCLQVYNGSLSLLLAMGFGTGTGLVAKYILDKRWIFRDTSSGLQNHGRKFSLYALMGVGTTAIFWGMEAGFNALSADGRYRFVGAALGLGIGYVTKYWLDRRFVFGGER